MLSWAKRLFTRPVASSAHRRPNPRRFRPVVEELETRVVPTTLNLMNSSGLDSKLIQVVGWATGPFNSQANTTEYQLTSGGTFTAKSGDVSSFPLIDLAKVSNNINLGTTGLSAADIVMEYRSDGTTFSLPFGQVPVVGSNTAVPTDFIEFTQVPPNLPTTAGYLSIDTSQVNGFGFPFTLTDVQQNQSVGVASGVTRNGIIQGYQKFTSGNPAFQNLVIPATTHDSNYTALGIEAPSKIPQAGFPSGLASYFDGALKTLFNGTTPLKIFVTGVTGGPYTYTATPVKWEYDTADSIGGNTYVYVNNTLTKQALPTLTETGASYNYQASDGSQFWPALEFSPSGSPSGEAAGPFFVFAPWWQTNGYTAQNNPLGSTPPTDAPSWIKVTGATTDQISPGQMVFGASQIFADQGAGPGTGATAGQVVNQVGNQTLYQTILAQLENQVDAALQRGVANLNYTTTKDSKGVVYTDSTSMWAGPVPGTSDTQTHTPYYPAGQTSNVYADALHNMKVSNLSGQSVFPFINQQAYAISYDDQGGNASILPSVPIGDTVQVTLDQWLGGTTAPVPPTSLTAIPGNNLVNLSWSPVSTAVGYNIYRGTSSGGEMNPPLNRATPVTGTTFTDATAVNGTTYYYVVDSVNSAGQESFTDSPEAAATPTANTVGVFDPNNAIFHITSVLGNPGPTDYAFQYGGTGWKPFAGNFSGTGHDTPGLFDPNNAIFHLSKILGNPGAGDVAFQYGGHGWDPLAGNFFTTATDTVGVFDPNNAIFHLSSVLGNPGANDYAFQYGGKGWIPIAGDFFRTGQETVGVFDPNNAIFHLSNVLGNPGGNDYAFQYGGKGWIPIVGDFFGTGHDTVGVFDPTNAIFHLSNVLGNPGTHDYAFQYGGNGWVPLAGDWGLRIIQLPQLAAGGEAPVPSGAAPLTETQLQSEVQVALNLLAANGVNQALLAQLGSLQFSVGQLPAGTLGLSNLATDQVEISADAAGYGWFVDANPSQKPPADRMDLLTVVLHEMGHFDGWTELDPATYPDALMALTLAPGQQRIQALDAVFGG